MRRHRVTHFDGSDEMVHRLLEAGGDESVFSRINFTGFAAFNSYLDDIVERAERAGLFLCGLWGMSEMQALVARRDRDQPAEVRNRGGGRMVSPTGAVRVRDPESGEILADGEPGELEIRGPSMMSGYLDNPDATAETVTADGFVRTGDLCCTEPGGGFHYLSRMGDVLRLGGYLVSPAEIEAEIQRDPAVGAVQVVSAPARGADRAVAFVIAAEGARVDEAALRARCAERLARFKVPERVIPVDAFPVTESANGVKIQRARLRQMALDALGPEHA
jgi:fatty-acyl-CoA synthase